MSIQLIQKYYTEIDKIILYSGSRNESSLRRSYQGLLEGYARGNCPNSTRRLNYSARKLEGLETMKIIKEMGD
jgi:hypothetical protein